MKQDRILGALYGQALGDAMGMPSELWPRKRVKAHFGWIDRFLPGPAENNAACYFKQAEFTDDTSMALCLADAIIECEGEINPDVIGKHILDWALDFDAFNKNVLGPTSKIALNAIRDGKPVSQLENNGVTNGAAMRASPLGCLLPATRLAHFVEQVALASSPTHKSRHRRCGGDRLGGFTRYRRRALAEHRRCPAGYCPCGTGGEHDHLQRITFRSY